MHLMSCAIRWLLILCFPILIPLHASAAAPRGSGAAHERSVTKGGGATSSAGGLLWRPSWPRTEIAVVSGDLSSKGPFVFRFRMPGGYWIHPHRHPVDARLRVISGTFLVGMGERLDSTKVEVLKAGREIRLSAGMAHFEGTRGATVVEISGDGPWGIRFLDPTKDPSATTRTR